MTLVYSGGNLTLSGVPNAPATGPNSALAVTRTSGTNYQVTDGTTNLGTYAVTGNVNLSLTRDNTNININLAGGLLPGNLTIDLGLGDTDLTTTNPVSVFGGGASRVGGTVTVKNGSGVEVINIGGTQSPLIASPVTIGGGVTTTLRNRNDLFGDTLFIGPGSTVNGLVNATQTDNVNVLFDPISTLSGRVGGGIIANNSGSSTALSVIADGTVNNGITMVGSSNASFGDEFRTGTFGTGTVNGNVTLSLAGGLNFVNVLTGSALSGNLTVTGDTGSTTTATLSGTVNGSVGMTLGNGDNSVSLSGAVGGNLSVYAGNGADTVSITGSIGGNVSANLNNGANVLGLNGAISGARVDYTGGSGADSVSVSGTNSFAMNLNLGAGADTVSFANNATTVGSATIDFGVDFDTDVLDLPVGYVFTYPMVLRNYP
jgi:hypothetical protein